MGFSLAFHRCRTVEIGIKLCTLESTAASPAEFHRRANFRQDGVRGEYRYINSGFSEEAALDLAENSRPLRNLPNIRYLIDILCQLYEGTNHGRPCCILRRKPKK
jgi:hypothetical protein